MSDSNVTDSQPGSRFLFSTYKEAGKVRGWSVRDRYIRDETGKPIVLCQAHNAHAERTHDIMEEFFADASTEARLREIMARHGEPTPGGQS